MGFIFALLVAAAISGKKSPQKLKPFPVVFTPPGPDGQPPIDAVPISIEGETTITTEDEWKCSRADDLLVPNPQSIVPAPMLGGPIATAIVAGIASVNAIAKALKWKQRCTIRGGRFNVLEVVGRQPLRVWLHVELVPRGQPPIARWVFDTKAGSISNTGVVPLREALIVGSAEDFSAPAREYLLNGGEPPGPWWPHVNIADWLHPVPLSLRAPRADVVRSGNDLAIGVWIPPRAPPSHLNALGKRIVDRPLDWRVQYWIGKPGGE